MLWAEDHTWESTTMLLGLGESLSGADEVTVSGSLTASTLDDLLRSVLNAILRDGQTEVDAPTRGANSELVGVRLELTNPRARLSLTETRRKPTSALAELCWYFRGSDRADEISAWIPRYSEEAEDDGRVHGAYGPRLFGSDENDQLRRVIDLLRASPGTRRAVLQLFDRADLVGPARYKDVPCTCTIQFLCRAGLLHAVTYMRSSDAYMGLAHDVFAFTMLQEIVARELGLEVGRYVHMAGSLHLYADKVESAKEFLAEGWQSTGYAMPSMPSGSQCDNIRELLRAERQIRLGTRFEDVSLPGDAYWADLARLLAITAARRRQAREEADEIARDLTNEALSLFT